MESETVLVELTQFAIRGVFVFNDTKILSRALEFFQFAFIEPHTFQSKPCKDSNR